jgi:hypothetical protein
MSIHLEQEVADYSERRMHLATAITEYADWLDRQHGIDASRTLRLADTATTLRQDKLVVAFVAEFSRGKTELINALFFADHGQRLLPSDAGRTTMCPTELFSNTDEPPSLHLLPIESRRRSESLAHLKRMPIEWIRINLDPGDPDQLQESLKKRLMPSNWGFGAGKIQARNISSMPTVPSTCQRGAMPQSIIRIPCCRLD